MSRRATKIRLELGPVDQGRHISLLRASDLHAYIWIGSETEPGHSSGNCYGTLDEPGMRRLRKAIDDALTLRAKRIVRRQARKMRP